MLCERCREIESTVHLTEIIKSVRSEVHLCERCAREIGLNSKLSSYSLSIPDMLSFLDQDVSDPDICPSCGTVFREIEDKGLAGCSVCYTHFKERIVDEFTELKRSYCGKHPFSSGSDSKALPDPASGKEETSGDLEVKLEDAVQEERYEDAARIRDILRARMS
ncbi:MAG: UvrB/UvrC motif-containing protein [Spirochaetota bacterium]